MIKFIDQYASKIAIAVLVGGICLTHPVYAADSSAEAHAGAAMKHQSGQDRVEKRIKALHDRLKITHEQESQFEAVAKIMRENEAAIHTLVEVRHANESASAIDDLKSYKEIASAHVEGLEKLIPAFEDLYNNLSDKQKANADKLFGKYEGHSGHKGSKTDASKEAK